MSKKRLLFPLGLLLLALLPSCMDTEDDDDAVDDDDTVDELFPSGSVSVTSVDLGIVCAATEATVTVSNDGTGVLTISEVIADGGWTLVSSPTEVAAGATADVVVSSAGGDGTLEIHTDDAANPILSVNLTAIANQAPAVQIDAGPGIVAPGATHEFTASVGDDWDDASTLSLQWASDVDGELGTASADGTGAAVLSWDGTLQTSGGHTITLIATDSCGAAGEATVTVCQNLGYTEESAALDTWQFTGNAKWDEVNEWVELTDTSSYIVGTAFQTSETISSDNVSIGFRFFASGGSGADGLSLTAIDTTRMTTYAGTAGGAMGYGSLPGWTVEVDLWDNTGDPGLFEPLVGDHVSVVIDGASDGIGEVSAAIPEVEDNAWHEMQVDVAGQNVTVSIDGVIYIDEAVAALVPFPAHIGFTAATGFVTNNHFIDSLAVKRFVCE